MLEYAYIGIGIGIGALIGFVTVFGLGWVYRYKRKYV